MENKKVIVLSGYCYGGTNMDGTIAEIKRTNMEHEDNRYVSEDVLTDSLGVAEELYRFVEVVPTEADRLRLRVKKTIDKTGKHSVPFGSERGKYRVSRDTIGQLLDSGIDKNQMDRTGSDSLCEFEQEAGSALEYFGYNRIRQQ